MNNCPSCGSTNVDWGFDSDAEPGQWIRDDACCQDCSATWVMVYKFDRMEGLRNA